VTMWVARVEVTNDAVTADELDDVLDDLMILLADYGAVVTFAEFDAGGGCFAVLLTFTADTLRLAVETALELVESAANQAASGVEVLPAEVYDARVSAESART
jgi:hypothetical protein